MSKPATKPKSTKAPLPPKLHPYEDAELCRVMRVENKELEFGMILARRGAWNHKYVCTHVVHVGEKSVYNDQKRQVYAVGVRYLGSFYADGRVEPTKRLVDKEFEVETLNCGQIAWSIGNLVPVVPSGKMLTEPAPPLVFTKTADMNTGLLTPVPAPAPKVKAKPEDILADYILK